MVAQFTNDTWYPVDLIINWENQTVTAYVNYTQSASDDFFFDQSYPNVNTSNTIILYNLTPGTICKIKNLKICKKRCSGN